VWDPYLFYLNVQIVEAEPPPGTRYWRLTEGYVTPPPDEGMGDVILQYQTKDADGYFTGGQTVRIFSDGGTWHTGTSPGTFAMSGGNWLDFYNQIGPYKVEILEGRPSDVCWGLGLPGNHHFSYRIVFREVTQGETANPPPLPPLGKPEGTNLLVNPGAETGNGTGWSLNGVILDGDIFQNCGNRAGSHRFSWQTYGPGQARMEQTAAVTPGQTYTFGFWLSKKSSEAPLTMTVTWEDNAGGSGTLYTVPGSETIFPIYGTRQDATFVPTGSAATVRLQMAYGGGYYAAFHLDEFWLVDVTQEPLEASWMEFR
jgi:hypothetical protein